MNTFNNLIPSKEIEYQTPKLKEEDIIINVKDENLENLNINEEQKKNIQSETSEDYKSILSHRTYLSMNSKSEYTSIKENKLNDKKRKKINEENSLFGVSNDDDSSKDESTFKEQYEEMRKCLDNKDITLFKEIKADVISEQINLRREKHNEKLKKLSLLEETLKNSRGNYVIKNYDNNNDEFILANIDPNRGYDIISLKEFEENYQKKTFKDYEYYIKKPI